MSATNTHIRGQWSAQRSAAWLARRGTPPTPQERQAARLAAEAMGRPLHLTAEEAARWEAAQARQWTREEGA